MNDVAATMTLELRVSDPDLVTELAQYQEPKERSEFALNA